MVKKMMISKHDNRENSDMMTLMMMMIKWFSYTTNNELFE